MLPEGTDASATDATTTESTETTTETSATEVLGAEGEKALAAFKSRARDAEKAAKAATAELAKLREQTMSEQEKAVAQAKAEGRTEALREAGVRLVDAEVRVAAAGRNVDVDALLENVDRTKFLGDDGEPDRPAIQAWIDRLAPEQQEPSAPGFPSLEQGARGKPVELGSDQLLNDLKAKVGIR